MSMKHFGIDVTDSNNNEDCKRVVICMIDGSMVSLFQVTDIPAEEADLLEEMVNQANVAYHDSLRPKSMMSTKAVQE